MLQNERIKKYTGVVADLFEEFKLSGRASCAPRPVLEYERVADVERLKLNATFPGGENRKGKHVLVDKESVIRRYHRIYLRGRYPWGVPENFLTGPKVVAILDNRKARERDEWKWGNLYDENGKEKFV